MSKDKKPVTKKEKKAALRKKNRKLFELFLTHKRLNDEVDIAAPEIEKPKPEAKKVDADGEQITQHVQMVRNRVTGRKRKAQDRWNRFAGTSGAGGRGR